MAVEVLAGAVIAHGGSWVGVTGGDLYITQVNAGVERFTADPRAVAKLAYDADLSGLIVLPTITMHALHDPTIPFAVEADYGRVVQAAGRSQLIVQTATDERGHSKLAETQYLALLTALLDWISSGHRPEPDDIGARCRLLEAAAPGGCHFAPTPPAAHDPTADSHQTP